MPSNVVADPTTFAGAVAILAAQGRRAMSITTADGLHRVRCHHCGAFAEMERNREHLEDRILAHDDQCKVNQKG